MSDLYNKPFKRGIVVTVAIFILLNLASWFVARREYDAGYEAGNLFFAPGGRVRWGFPFALFGGDAFDEMIGITLNFSVAAVCAVLVGILARVIFKAR